MQCMRLLWLSLVAAACNPSSGEREVTLAAFQTLHISASEQSFKILLDDGQSSPRPGPCSVAGAQLTAQLNEVSVPVVTRGGKIGESPGDDVSDNDCDPPVLQLDTPPPDGASTLKLSDSSTMLICSVPDLKARRQATLIAPDSGSWTWRPGQAVAMQWSPGDDLRLGDPFHVQLRQLGSPNMVYDLVENRDVTFEGDVLRFTVPASAGAGLYTLQLGPSRVLTCGARPPVAEVSSTLTSFLAEHSVMIVL